MTSMFAGLRPHVLPLSALALLVLAVFYRLVLNPCSGLYSEVSDLPSLNMPIKLFLAESYRATGEIPLWNPHVCAGMPFVHDSQTAAFYPLHIVLYLLPAEWMQATLSWLTVLHVMIAGWCMYAYAYSTGLGRLASFTAGAGYMLSGKWLLHIVTAGHYPFVALAWLPLLLMFLDQAIQRGSIVKATYAGIIYAIIILGSHPQLIFYSGLFAALWSLGAALSSAGWLSGLRKRSLPTAIGLWLIAGAWTFATAVALAAIQLLPNLEIVPHGSRSLGIHSWASSKVVFWSLLMLVGPPMGDPSWESQGGLGVVWIGMAFVGLCVGSRKMVYYSIAGLVVIVYSVGGSQFLQGLPGFNLFRCPGRMLWFLYVPSTLLVANALQNIIINHLQVNERKKLSLILIAALVLGFIVLASLGGLVRAAGAANQPLQIYWPIGITIVGCTAYVLFQFPRLNGTVLAIAMVGALLADLVLVIFPFIQVRDYNAVLVPSASVTFLQRGVPGSRCLDRDPVGGKGGVYLGSGPVGLSLPMLTGLEPVRGWHSIDVLRYKEYLAFISDRNKPFSQKDVVINFPIINKQLLDALAVRYIVQPSDPEFAIRPETPLAKDERYRAVFTDEHPIGSYNVMSYPRITKLPPYTVYENLEAFPRAWLVGEAIPAPDRTRMLETLKATDLRRTVLLEGLPEPEKRTLNLAECQSVLRQPNRLVYRTRTDEQAFLVFSEIWFPGWRCFIDGVEVPIYRANHALRAVRVPGGEHEVVMVMDPASLRWGKWISIGSLVVLLGTGIVGGAVRLVRRRSPPAE